MRVPTKGLTSKQAQVLRTPRHATFVGLSVPMAVVVQPPKVVTLAADFAPTKGWTNLTAWFEVKTNSNQKNWIRVGEIRYPTNGGTLKAPWTNTGPFFFRAGFTIRPNTGK